MTMSRPPPSRRDEIVTTHCMRNCEIQPQSARSGTSSFRRDELFAGMSGANIVPNVDDYSLSLRWARYIPSIPEIEFHLDNNSSDNFPTARVVIENRPGALIVGAPGGASVPPLPYGTQCTVHVPYHFDLSTADMDLTITTLVAHYIVPEKGIVSSVTFPHPTCEIPLCTYGLSTDSPLLQALRRIPWVTWKAVDPIEPLRDHTIHGWTACLFVWHITDEKTLRILRSRNEMLQRRAVTSRAVVVLADDLKDSVTGHGEYITLDDERDVAALLAAVKRSNGEETLTVVLKGIIFLVK